jgi:hypothetical protein
MHAHHFFPHEFGDKFWSAGIDVNGPRFGAWWDGKLCLDNHAQYNRDWDKFLEETRRLRKSLNAAEN